MTPNLWATFFAAVVVTSGSVLVAVITVRQNRRGATATNQLEERKVDLDVFESSVAELRLSLKEVRDELAEERSARRGSDEKAAAAQQRAAKAEQRTAEVEAQGKRLARRLSRSERRVAQLQKAMEDAAIPVPVPLPDTDLP